MAPEYCQINQLPALSVNNDHGSWNFSLSSSVKNNGGVSIEDVKTIKDILNSNLNRSYNDEDVISFFEQIGNASK